MIVSHPRLTPPNLLRETELHQRLAQAGALASLLVAAGGVIVLFGWTLRLDILKSVLPGFVAMKANAAVGFLLLGLALTCQAFARRSKPLKLLALPSPLPPPSSDS